MKTFAQCFVSSKITQCPESPDAVPRQRAHPLPSQVPNSEIPVHPQRRQTMASEGVHYGAVAREKDPQRTHTSSNIHWRSTFGVNMKTKNDCFRVIQHPLKEGRRMRNSHNCNLSHGLTSVTKWVPRRLWRPKTKQLLNAMSQRPPKVHRKRVSNWDTNKSLSKQATKCPAEFMLPLSNKNFNSSSIQIKIQPQVKHACTITHNI